MDIIRRIILLIKRNNILISLLWLYYTIHVFSILVKFHILLIILGWIVLVWKWYTNDLNILVNENCINSAIFKILMILNGNNRNLCYVNIWLFIYIFIKLFY